MSPLDKETSQISGEVQAPGPAPVAGSIDIGMSPLVISGLMLLATGPGVALVGALFIAVLGPAGVLLILICAIPWLIVLAALGVQFVMLLLTGGGLHYRRTKAAIREGRIDVSYYLRGAEDVIVVDEKRRLICCNGDVFGFDDVKRLNWQSGNKEHRLDFVLSGGANPIRSAELNNESALRLAFERLGNSLGFE